MNLTSLTKVSLCLWAMCIITIAQAQEVQEKQRKMYLSLSGSGFIVGSDAFACGSLTFGYLLSPKNLLSVEIGGGSGTSKQIGSYSYTYTETNSSGQVVNSGTLNDGKISYQYTPLDFTLSYSRLFKLSDKWTLRVGPALGILSISGSDNYSPRTYKGATISGIPALESESKTAFMAGVLVGAQWNLAKRWFLDLNYRASVNTSINFPERTINVMGHNVSIDSKEFGMFGNRISAGIGFRF